jgi:hypothetical protein
MPLHQWSYSGLTSAGAKLWSCDLCGREETALSKLGWPVRCDGRQPDALPANPEPGSQICTDCGKWRVWSEPEAPQRGMCVCRPVDVKPLTPSVDRLAVFGMPLTTQGRMNELATHAARLSGPGSDFFVAVAFGDAPGISSLSNLGTARQVELLRALLQSFDSGGAAPMPTQELPSLVVPTADELELIAALRDTPRDWLRQFGRDVAGEGYNGNGWGDRTWAAFDKLFEERGT